MVYSFRELQEDVLDEVYLGDTFAEDVVIRLVSGVDVPITVHIDGARDRDDIGDSGASSIERIRVLISRVTSEEENTRGFVEVPAIGTKLYRVDNDPWEEPYVYTGEIEDERPTKWRLVFERAHLHGQASR